MLTLLDARELYEGGGDGRPARYAPGIHLIVMAAALARTPDVKLPDPSSFFAQSSGTPDG